MNKRILPISLLGLCGLFNINCASDDQDGQDSDEGIILLSLAQAPVDARCLQVTIAGSRTVESFIDLQPGQTTTVQIDRLPLGIATVDGHAFSTMCDDVAPGDAPNYVAEAPVSVRIDPVDVARVSLTLIRDAKLDIDVEFEEGPSPYLVAREDGIIIKDLLTVGDSVDGYRMVGIPDGLGAYDNGDGTFTTLMNQELSSGRGVVRAHGADGAFVSRWTVRASDMTVLSGSDLIQGVATWDTATSSYNAPATGVSMSRFCSGDLPAKGAYWNAATSTGFDGLLFMNGEESGSSGRALAHGLDGISWELPRLGKASWENVVANPDAGDKTVTIGLDDSTGGQLYVYVGTKTNSGSPVERAGLTNGTLYGVKVSGVPNEPNALGIASGTAFTLAPMGNVENTSGSALQSASVADGVTGWLRPEDGAWDVSNPNDFYFVTTNGFNNPSRLFRLRFADRTQPELGGTVDMLLDGTEGQQMFDNIGLDKYGHVYLTEDPGGNDHLAKVWRYDIATDTSTVIIEHDPSKFAPGAPFFLTTNEEASGVIDASEVLGEGWFLIDTQAHYNIGDAELVEGGQFLAFFDPASHA